MNDKFFDIKTDKQERILNAAIKVFCLNGYRKASTDIIVKEAGISKGLLFHYFTNKLSLYEYIIEYSVRYMAFEIENNVSKIERDFFELQMQMESAKIRVMKAYPYMQLFLASLKYENDKEALSVMGDRANALDNIYNSIYKQSDNTRFQDYVVIQRVVDMIRWMSDGFLREHIDENNPDVEALSTEFGKYLKMIKAHFYKGGMTDINEEDIAVDRPQ